MKNNNAPFLTLFIKVFLVLSLVGLIVLSGVFLNTGYEELVDWVLGLTGKEDKIEIFERDFLTIQKFTIIRICLPVLVLFYVILLYFLFPRILLITHKFRNFWMLSKSVALSGIREFYKLSFFHKLLFFLLFFFILFFRLYYLFVFPLNNDEIFTYLYFVKPGFLAAITYYPGPNNHVFYSLCCNFIDFFLNSDKLILRLPSYIAGLLSVLILFFYFLKRYSFTFAFLVILYFSSFETIFYYSFHGRGYSFIYLFFILTYISVLEINSQRNIQFWKVAFIMATVLGFYSIPVFLYPFASLAVFVGILYVNKKHYFLLQKFTIWALLAGFLTLLLYLPIFVVSGWNAIAGNAFVKPMKTHEFFEGLPAYLLSVTEHWWNSSWGLELTILLFLAGFFVLFVLRKIDWILLIASCFLLPLAILVIQRVHPFARVWDYLLVLFAVLGAFCVSYLINFITRRFVQDIIIIVLWVSISGCLYYNVHTFTKRGFPYYTSLNESLKNLFTKDFHSAYVDEDSYLLFLNYYAEKQNRKVLLQNASSASHPDVVILPVNKTFTDSAADYFIFNRNQFVTIWIKKGIK